MRIGGLYWATAPIGQMLHDRRGSWTVRIGGLYWATAPIGQMLQIEGGRGRCRSEG